MTYTRQYPQTITADGTDIQTGFENDDSELKRIYGLLDSVGVISLAGTKRQSVLYASTLNGEPNFLSASGLNVSLDGSTTNVLLAFAYGFDDKGAVDYINKISTLTSNAWTLPSNSTVYLYIDRDISTGLISYNYSSLEDLYQKATPTATLDQHWYDTNECKMKRYNGSTWEVKQRVFVAKAVTDTITATLTIYPLKTRISVNADTALVASSVTDEYKNTLLSAMYPIGAIYMSVVSTSPATLFGGTWSQIKDTFLLACGDTYANGTTGGEATHTLSVDEMPAHTHSTGAALAGSSNMGFPGGGVLNITTVTGSTGGGLAHNNMPPYLAVYTWKRTA